MHYRMKCSSRMLASVLLFFVAIKLIQRVKSLPVRTKRSVGANLGDSDYYSSYSRPIFTNYYDDLDDYDYEYDDEDDFSGDYDDIVHEPIKNRQPVWKINLNTTNADSFMFDDMRLDPIQALVRAPLLEGTRVKRAARSKEPNYLWRYNTIFYKIDHGFDRQTKKEIKLGIRHWKKALKGCLKFIRLDRDPKIEKRISRDKFGGGNVHHVLFTKTDTGCWSNVGRVDTKFQDRPSVIGQQVISIGKGCGEKGTVIHEIGHAVGFWHEQSRRDRDKYVKILVNNILPGQEEQFGRMNENQVGSMGYAYDFWSIMHYGPNFFSKNKKPTIKIQKSYRNIYPKPNIGQRERLSFLDIAQVRAMYKCNILPSRESERTCIKRKNKGQDYRGTLDYTKSGVMCQPWDKKYPQSHNYKLYDNNDGLGKHNYCRNPGGEKERPWCFTLLGPNHPKWEYCDLKFCNEKKLKS